MATRKIGGRTVGLFLILFAVMVPLVAPFSLGAETLVYAPPNLGDADGGILTMAGTSLKQVVDVGGARLNVTSAEARLRWTGIVGKNNYTTVEFGIGPIGGGILKTTVDVPPGGGGGGGCPGCPPPSPLEGDPALEQTSFVVRLTGVSVLVTGKWIVSVRVVKIVGDPDQAIYWYRGDVGGRAVHPEYLKEVRREDNSTVFGLPPRNLQLTGSALEGRPSDAPQASFSFTVDGFDATFTDRSTAADGRTIALWTWDLGDGNTSSEPDPAHTYGAAGTYDVRLTVVDSEGASDTARALVEIVGPGETDEGMTTSPSGPGQINMTSVFLTLLFAFFFGAGIYLATAGKKGTRAMKPRSRLVLAAVAAFGYLALFIAYLPAIRVGI